jgi:hypothetical protein
MSESTEGGRGITHLASEAVEEIETRLLIAGERVAGEGEGVPVEIAPKEWWYPYSRYAAETPHDGAGA